MTYCQNKCLIFNLSRRAKCFNLEFVNHIHAYIVRDKLILFIEIVRWKYSRLSYKFFCKMHFIYDLWNENLIYHCENASSTLLYSVQWDSLIVLVIIMGYLFFHSSHLDNFRSSFKIKIKLVINKKIYTPSFSLSIDISTTICFIFIW